MVRDTVKWEVDTKIDASEFDAEYYRTLQEKVWDKVTFVRKDCYQ